MNLEFNRDLQLNELANQDLLVERRDLESISQNLNKGDTTHFISRNVSKRQERELLNF